MLQHADPSQEVVTIPRALFEKIDAQGKTVAESELRLSRATNAQKDAKKQHEGDVATYTALVSEMRRLVNGEASELPLIDMHDTIARAEADPIATTLLDRLITHGYENLNLLIVHGYTEEQRGELTAFLDGLDLRAKERAEFAERGEEYTEDSFQLTEPAFIAAQAVAEAIAAQDAAAPTDAQIEAAFARHKMEFNPALSHMTAEQRFLALAYSDGCVKAYEEKGADVTFDDLPPAPDFVDNPRLLLPAADLTIEPVDDAAPAPATDKAPRRNSKKFKSTVGDQLKAKKAKGKGKK